jgi:hypothetical protein
MNSRAALKKHFGMVFQYDKSRISRRVSFGVGASEVFHSVISINCLQLTQERTETITKQCQHT